MYFAVFIHVEHKKKASFYYGYAPYIREMNLWLRYVEEVEVVAPFSGLVDPNMHIPYRHENLFFTDISSFDFLSLKNSIKAFVKLPLIIYKITRAMLRADHLHLRCPGNIGLVACFLQIFFPKKPKTAKYAGNWDPEAKQPWTYKLQKWILNNTFLTRNIKVLVYGEWPGQSKNIRPFFTASFSEKEIDTVKEKSFKPPFNFVFVGNLVPGKHPLLAVKIVEELENSGYDVNLEVYGDGPEMQLLQEYRKKNSLEAFVSLKGNRPLQKLKEAYQKAHFLVLPSESEGWPKAVAEAMFFGCIPIITAVSCVPWMLGSSPAPASPAVRPEGGVSRGIILKENQEQRKKSQDRNREWTGSSGQWTLDAQKIHQLLDSPGEMRRMSDEAKKWSQQYTLERFEEGIREVLGKTKGDL